MSAIAEENGDAVPEIKVLFCLYENFDTLDVAGPLETLSLAVHDSDSKNSLYPLHSLFRINGWL